MTNYKLNSRDDILSLLKKLTGKSFDIIEKHSIAVEKLALHISSQIKQADDFIVMAGALLHDVGRKKYPPKHEENIMHGLEGYNMLKEIGVDNKIALIARNHIGSGISKADIKEQNLSLPIDDYIPKSMEEIIVAYADNRVRYDEIKSVWYPILRFSKSIGKKYGERVLAQHNFLVKNGFKFDLLETEELRLNEMYEKINNNINF